MTEADEYNVELIERGIGAFSRGAFDEGIADMHPEIEWHVSFRLPDLPLDKPVYEGRDEVRLLWEFFTGAWETITLDVEEVVANTGGRIVTRARFRGRGAASGAEVDRVVYYAFRIEDQLLRWIRPFDTEGEARAALGIGDVP